MDYRKMTVPALRELARARSVKYAREMKKAELVQALNKGDVAREKLVAAGRPPYGGSGSK